MPGANMSTEETARFGCILETVRSEQIGRFSEDREAVGCVCGRQEQRAESEDQTRGRVPLKLCSGCVISSSRRPSSTIYILAAHRVRIISN